MEQAQIMWLLRMLLVSAGGWLAGKGIGDAALWEAVTGAVLGLAGAVWSFQARRSMAAQAAAAVSVEAAVLAHVGAGKQ